MRHLLMICVQWRWTACEHNTHIHINSNVRFASCTFCVHSLFAAFHSQYMQSERTVFEMSVCICVLFTKINALHISLYSTSYSVYLLAVDLFLLHAFLSWRFNYALMSAYGLVFALCRALTLATNTHATIDTAIYADVQVNWWPITR